MRRQGFATCVVEFGRREGVDPLEGEGASISGSMLWVERARDLGDLFP